MTKDETKGCSDIKKALELGYTQISIETLKKCNL